LTASFIISLLYEIESFNDILAGIPINKSRTSRSSLNSQQQESHKNSLIRKLFGCDVRRLTLEQARCILSIENWESNDFQDRFKYLDKVDDCSPYIRLTNINDNV
jgi:hypothetical protein